jgi:undecaprenyl-diphosphatase
MTRRELRRGAARLLWSAVRREWRALLAILAVAVAVLGFAELADAVLAGQTLSVDRWLLLALRNPSHPSDPIGPSWLEDAARDITGLGSHAVLGLASLAALGFLLLTRKRGAAMLVALCISSGWAMSAVLKLVFDRPRPDLVPHGVAVYTASFPSQHAMLSALVYLTLGALLIRVHPSWPVKLYVLTLAVLITLLVGLSRIYLGVHWPTDVLAGWCLGAAWALGSWRLALWLQRSGTVEAPDEEQP